ncbi:MAG: hypothetical protein ACYS8W_03270 [Planctomycetota bacterium]
MKIVVNGREDIVEADSGSRFGTILDQLRRWLLEDDMLILTLLLDGKPLDETAENRHVDSKVDEFKELIVEAAAAKDLALDALGNVKQYCDRVRNSQLTIADGCRKGALEDANEFNFIFTWWESLQRSVVNVIRLMKLDPESIRVDKTSLGDHLAGLTTPLAEMDGALKAQDFVLVGDLLEHEFTPRLDTWLSFLDTLTGMIESIPGPGEENTSDK